MKKLKKEEGLSYQDLAARLGYSSGTTVHRFITTGNIPKKRYSYLDNKLKWNNY